MTLRDRAIEAHKAAEAEHLAAMREEAERFALKALRELERWGITDIPQGDIEHIELPDVPKPPYEVKFYIVAGEIIKARREYGQPVFYLAQFCRCGAMVWAHVASLADIGKALLAEPMEGCEKCDTGGQSIEHLTWRDRLADAVAEAIEQAIA